MTATRLVHRSPQPGIFALGTTDHTYLELALRSPDADPDAHAHAGSAGRRLLNLAVGLIAGLTTTSGVNVVLGLRPELWAQLAADASDVPTDVHSFDTDVVGPDGFTMPATQHDAWVWISGGNRAAVFDAGQQAIHVLSAVADVRSETGGWLYRHSRDLTGFVDGTENPTLLAAPGVAAVPEGRPGAGSSVVLYQLWRHDTAAWTAQPQAEQERVIGRTKPDSVELPEDEMPADSHVSRSVVEVDGEELDIYRRNVAYGGVTDSGTVFVGFSQDQWRMAEMLRRMAGVGDGVRCALTRYTTPLNGAYYVVPAVEALAAFAPDDAA